MRTVYHEKLSELSEQLGRMCGLAGAAMERATRALMQADLTSAEPDRPRVFKTRNLCPNSATTPAN
jgi:phosphate uptake regulator